MGAGYGRVGIHWRTLHLAVLNAGHRVRTTVRFRKREAGVRAMLKTGGAEPGEALSFVAADLMMLWQIFLSNQRPEYRLWVL
jgi:hypothetical protein